MKITAAGVFGLLAAIAVGLPSAHGDMPARIAEHISALKILQNEFYQVRTEEHKAGVRSRPKGGEAMRAVVDEIRDHCDSLVELGYLSRQTFDLKKGNAALGYRAAELTLFTLDEYRLLPVVKHTEKGVVIWDYPQRLRWWDLHIKHFDDADFATRLSLIHKQHKRLLEEDLGTVQAEGQEPPAKP